MSIAIYSMEPESDFGRKISQIYKSSKMPKKTKKTEKLLRMTHTYGVPVRLKSLAVQIWGLRQRRWTMIVNGLFSKSINFSLKLSKSKKAVHIATRTTLQRTYSPVFSQHMCTCTQRRGYGGMKEGNTPKVCEKSENSGEK